ncbi:DUF4350 domain-containing protein [Paenibacillus cremeus]|uniref:Ig domain-containing protein group 2 domain-containing protein n=1 Tax=Paenibacillus cremeus TaxID=2163881 RepID=A0A559KE72_9BACL|nr:DUF4350 domain-containing protein [Paenibacillus cremeus]TVY10436.1 Ig domain-containing protein group 2 domain-containing protein [Paenibacillus cremeus]
MYGLMRKYLRRYKKWANLAMAVMLLTSVVLPNVLLQTANAAAETVANWSFTAANTALVTKASGGNAANSGNAELTLSNGRTPTYSTTGNTIYKDGWASPTGGYWQAKLSTEGYTGLTLSSKQYGTNGGPRDFKLQYSIDGTNFVDFSTEYQLTTSIVQKDIALPAQAENQPTLYIRWLNTSNASISSTNAGTNGTGTITQSSGNSRIADILVSGTPTSGSVTPVPVTGVSLNTNTVNLTVLGASYGLTATVAPAIATNKTVTWASNDTTVATVTYGTVTAVGVGTATITATTEDGNKQAAATVNVTNNPVSATGVTLDKSTLPLTVGGTGQLTATVQPTTATNKTVTWSSDHTDVATVNTSGKVTAVGTGTATITVTTADGSYTASATVNVTNAATYKPGDVVFSQLYINGGNSGAFYKTKFFELYNTTNQDIDFGGQWNIFYASATGSFNAGQVPLSGVIKAHGYFLVKGSTSTNGADLPVTEDASTSINPSGSTGGVLALASTPTGLTGQDDPKAIDMVAYGNGTNTNFTLKTDHWGAPFYNSSVGGGTILRKTDAGSDPRAAYGIGNGFFTKNPSNDFVLNAPASTSSPVEIQIRTSKSMISPDSAKLSFTSAGGNVVGTAGAVPGSSTVKAYVETSRTVTPVGQATAAAANGSFTLSFTNTNNNQSVYVTYTSASKESVYTRVDAAPSSSTPVSIGQLRTNDANGLLLNIGYTATIEGVVTSANKALGTEKTNFYVQDATGGLDVISGQDPSISILVGHKVKVTGKLIFTAGTAQLVATSTILDEGADTVPAAAPITLDALGAYATAEPLEGKLVTVKAKVSTVPASGPDYDVTVIDDANHTAVVRILGSTGIDVAGGAITQGETYTFTGVVAQSKKSSPFNAGYLLLPRSASDVKGELQLSHTPLLKAYTGIDVSFKATAKFADSVKIWYKGQSDANYSSVTMASADGLNYNGAIPQASMPTGKLLYYIEAMQGSTTKTVGEAAQPITIDVVPDTDGPDLFNMQPADHDEIESAHPVITANWEDPNGVNTSSVSIKINSIDYTSKAVISETGMNLTIADPDSLAVGIYTVEVSAKDKLNNLSTHTWSFKVLPRFSGGNHYYGTTHNHTNISHDADGSPEDALKAAEYHDYDWFAFSDHSHDIDASLAGTDTVDHNGMPERTGGSDWQLTKNLAAQYTKNGSFVVFPAFEMTSTTWGHSNVFGTTNFIDRVQSGGKYQNLQNYYGWVLTYDNVVAQFNHPAMSANAFDNFIPYDKNVDKLFTMLEVGNGSGKYSYANAESKFFSALDLGWHVAPTYGEDNHDATWGQTKQRTVIVADNLSQDSLIDAMRKMHVYMTEDPNAKLDVLASGWYMGSTTDTKNLQFSITGSDSVLESKSDPKYSYLKTVSNDNIAKIELITNGGRVIQSYVPTTDTTSFNWSPTVNVIGGQQWFVVRVTQKDGDRIYSSPIWSPEDPVAVNVNNVTVVEGAVVSGVAATLEAGVTNLGTTDVTDITAKFYIDTVDAGHMIGDAAIPSLLSSKSAIVRVSWPNPVAGEHKIIVILSSTDKDLGDNNYEQALSVKAPLGKTILIDTSKQNENTSTDSGGYPNNLKTFTVMMKQQGYTVTENTYTITDTVLNQASVLYITHPAVAYSAAEITAINNFVAKGGSLLLAERSNKDGSNQSLNAVLSGIGSSILVNNDGLYDESVNGNFFGDRTTYNYAVKAHPTPVSNGLTDFVPTIESFGPASLAKNDGAGNKVPLTDTDKVSILVRGNETTFQNSPNIKSDSVSYNVQTSNAPGKPTLDNVTGGSVIPMVASETLNTNGGRVIVTGMNIFHDKEMDQTYNAKGNVPFALNAVNWLAHLEPKVVSIADARKLPEGTNVVVQGKVTTAAGIFYDAAYLQDETGGIMAFSEVPEGSLKLGDTIRVYGHIGTFENDKELMFDKFVNSVVKLSSGTAVEPKLLPTGAVTSDTYQGQLVQVKGKVVSLPDANSIVVNDGSGDVLVFIDGYIVNESGVPIPQLHIGDTLQATGMSGKYSQGDRIRVRDTRELVKLDGSSVPVTGVTLNTNAFVMTVGSSVYSLTATIQPTDATNQAVTWTSSNPSVATVDAGHVTALAAGTSTITVITDDGHFTASATVTVTTPSNGGSSSSSSSSGSAPAGSTDSKTVTVSADSLTSSGSGKATVSVPAEASEVKLPSNTADLIKQGNLEIKSDKLTMSIPSELMKQLTSGLSADALQGSSISVQFHALSDAETSAALSSSKHAGNEAVKLAGEVYEFKLSITTADGKTTTLSKFDKPMVLTLKASSTVNPKLTGIYYISDEGKLEYVGGKFNSDGTVSAEIKHFSKYAVLEVNKTFADVPAGHWATDVIKELAAKQIVNGISDTAFAPERSVTRAEFTTLLVNALKLTASAKGDVSFSDVSASDWYAGAVAAAVKAGLVQGKSATTFDSNAQITREEMVTMLMRAYEYRNGKANAAVGSTFKDEAQISPWAAAFVKEAAALKLIQGRSAEQFEPNGITTRAEAAQVIYNLLK